MIVCVAGVLGEPERAKIAGLIGGAAFADGRETAGWHARLVKHNRQLADPAAASAAGALVEQALRRNEVARAALLPRRFRPILFSRYDTGMAYGAHVDDAIMGEDPVRSDVSFTVFLSAPEDYDGGELVIEGTAGEQAYKLGPGDAVLYPSTTLHRVEPVTRGSRLVAVGWAQSLVRSPAQREILFDLDRARRTAFAQSGKGEQFDLLAKSYSNLLRLWAET